MTVRGSDCVVALYDESTYATAPGSPAGRVAYYTELSLNPTRNNVIANTISADRNRSQPGQGNLDISGNINVEVAPENVGFWLKHLLGAPTTTGAGPYEHVFRPTTLPVGFIVEQDWTDAIASTVYRYLGCRIGSGTLTVPQEGFVTLNNSVNGSVFTVATSVLDASLDDPGHTGFDSTEATVKLAGTASTIIQAASITINNNMDANRYTIGNDGVRYDMPESFADVSGEITAIFSAGADALIDAAVARTDTTLELILTKGTGAGSAGNENLSIKLDHAQIALAAPPINSPGGLSVSFTFSAYKSGATDKGLIVTLDNAVAGASL